MLRGSTVRRRALALATAMLAVPSLAVADAGASKIVYVCGSELCAADPASGATATITTDGASSSYRYPSISRDGRRLAAGRGTDVMVGDYGANLSERWAGSRDLNDVALSPDGSAVAESHSYVENQYGCPFTGGCLRLVDMSASTYTAGPGDDAITNRYPGGGGVGFLGGGALLSSRYTIRDDLHQICVVGDPKAEDADCEPRVSSPATLSAPTGSPDGRLIAATVSPEGSDTATVALFDAATGAPVRQLAAAGSEPAFSPDGTQVAYNGGDGWIHVVATAGGRGRRLVQGGSPTWGDGAGPGAALGSRSLRLRGGRIPVSVSCGGPAPCRGSVRIANGRTTVGRRAYRVAGGRTAVVAVKPTRRGLVTLGDRRRFGVTVQLTPANGKRLSERLTLRR
jgi:hypothetical protein